MPRHGCICEASASTLIAGEIQSVQGAMRRNSRWASVPVYGRGEPSQSLANSMGLRDARRTGTGADGGSHANGATASTSSGPISLNAFAQLQALLRDGADFDRIDALVLLQPFLDVIRSGDTSGPITAAALASVDMAHLGGIRALGRIDHAVVIGVDPVEPAEHSFRKLDRGNPAVLVAIQPAQP